MTTKTLTPASTKSAAAVPALAYARKLNRQNYGPCTIVRAVAQKYPKLARREVLAIAEALSINRGTASRQYQEVRSGVTVVTGL